MTLGMLLTLGERDLTAKRWAQACRLVVSAMARHGVPEFTATVERNASVNGWDIEIVGEQSADALTAIIGEKDKLLFRYMEAVQGVA